MTRLPATLLLVALAAPLQAQSRVPYSSLRPTLVGFRFYGSAKGFFHSSERVYRTAFDSATAQYINLELDIDYPRTPSAVTFELDCRYQGPGGKAGSYPMIGEIGADQVGSKHAGGWGHEERGLWPMGSYQVTCRDGSTVVASGSFTVTKNQHDIPAIRGMVTRVRVVESTRNLPPVGERVFGVSFDSATARYISVELQVDFPPTATAIAFPIDCTYLYPNGETRNFLVDARVEAGWKDSAHTGGWGRDEPGLWAKGTYQITCRHQDRVIVQRIFRIT